MTAVTRAYELLIGTGNDGTNEHVDIALVNAAGDESNRQRPAEGDSRDNYEKGSIEIFDPVEFTLDGTPAQIKVYFSGSKWRLGGLWLTDKTTGETWYALPDCVIGSGSGASASPQTFDLQQISGVSGPTSFDEFKVEITTASGNDTGTDDQVFIKLFDRKARANITQRPGATDNILNPINDWRSGSTQSARIAATLTELGPISYILLCKYGSDSWHPSSVTVEGASLIPGTDARHFAISHPLTEDQNKWIFCRANEL